MKFAIPLVLVAVLALVGAFVLGLNDDPSPEASTTAESAVTGDVNTDPAAALAALSEAYRKLPSFRETIDQSYTTSRGDGTVSMQIACDADENIEMLLPGSRLVITDERLFMSLNLVPAKYMSMDAAGDPDTKFRTATQSKVSPVPLALRAAPTPELQIAALVLAMPANPRLQAVGLVTREDGTTQRKLTIAADDGSVEVYIDPTTGLLIETLIEHQAAPDQKRIIRSKFSRTPQPETIGFEVGERFQVASLAALKVAAVGEPAPELALPTLEGETITLSDYRGSVVVLDFWATWCGPCKRGLPLLNEFYVWAGKSGLPIEVLAVDVWERNPDPEVNRRAIEKYWLDSGFLMPTLIDDTSNATYPFGFRSIPTTIIIGPDGRIEKIHTGYDPDMVKTLQTEVQQILADA